jgi:PilZ domain-containing protein
MAEEINDGIAYLKALKRPVAPSAEEHPSSNNPVDEHYQGTEKRRSRRYKCEGSVQIRQEGRDVKTWASFTDISLQGCYVEAQATYPAGTLLQMKLEANGIRIETKGTVRVNYPYLGMGIAFVDMSEENQAHLRQMLATITHACVIIGPGIASSLPATGPLNAVPLITDPGAAVKALMEFFESRQMLMREDFLRIVRKSQTPDRPGEVPPPQLL